MKSRAWVFAGPALLVLGVFFFLPVLAGVFLSLTDYDIYALADARNLRFIGLDNYVELLRSSLFWKALGNTFLFVIVGVPLSIAFSLVAALLLNSRFSRWRAFFRTALFAPVVTTVVAVALIWRYLFDTRNGLLNQLLEFLGLPAVNWLGDPQWSMPAIILFAVWKNFGFNMIILLAALQTIPGDLYDAARIDGAGRGQRLLHVTVPALMPVLAVVSIMTTAGYFQLFAEPYVMTEGGPLQSTLSVLYLMYDEAFKWWNLGNASAIAILLFALILLATVAQYLLMRRRGLAE